MHKRSSGGVFFCVQNQLAYATSAGFHAPMVCKLVSFEDESEARKLPAEGSNFAPYKDFATLCRMQVPRHLRLLGGKRCMLDTSNKNPKSH
jgi:hypothetical protein